ncbi:MAG: universal stress protein [Sporocytophaga sp.]|uniref:universal stress protein n=1 Tax=Sporocytophaga sp. TaxID=2231183 RepID=UPI001AFFBB0C|nr:universal stress protein [Sporocytophaga sp.]MBO9702557.1 universal stress protein [Sporocytophaga sp.]
MKTILLPTNFSKASQKALEFAIMIAQKADAKIIVAHAYTLTSINAEPIPVVFENVLEETQEYLKSQLDSICGYISSFKTDSGKTINTQYIIQYNIPEQEIKELATRHQVDLIVMGTNNPEGLQGLVGSTIQNMIENTNVPILVIHEDTPVKLFNKIDFAIEKVSEKISYVKNIINLASIFKSEITLLHVEQYARSFQEYEKNTESSTASIILNSVKKITSYDQIKYKTTLSDIVEEGLHKGLMEDNSDLLVLIYNERNWLDALFHKSVIKSVLKKFSLPVLILHSNKSQVNIS